MSRLELPMAPAGTSGAPAASEPERDVHADARRFRVEGMDCAACAKTIEKAVAALDGVATAQVSFGAGTLVVEGDTSEAAISRAGYRARPADRRAAGRKRRSGGAMPARCRPPRRSRCWPSR